MKQFDGKPFDREQLVFVVEAAICSTLDKIDGSLPQTISQSCWEQNHENLRNYFHGAISQFGILIPILWAQMNDNEGMETQGFQGWDDFLKMCYNFIDQNTTKPLPKIQKLVPEKEISALANKIVDFNWDHYLTKNQ